jgi:hypothetical protein
LPFCGEEGNTIEFHVTVYSNATSTRVLGATVTIDLTLIGGVAGVPMNDSGLGADQFGGDGIYSASGLNRHRHADGHAPPAGHGHARTPVRRLLHAGRGAPGRHPGQRQLRDGDAAGGRLPISVPVVTLAGATVESNPTRTAGTAPPAFAFGTQDASRGVWYTVVGTGNTMTVDTCASASMDTVVNVYCGTCNGLTLVSSSDDFGAGCGACRPRCPGPRSARRWASSTTSGSRCSAARPPTRP